MARPSPSTSQRRRRRAVPFGIVLAALVLFDAIVLWSVGSRAERGDGSDGSAASSAADPPPSDALVAVDVACAPRVDGDPESGVWRWTWPRIAARVVDEDGRVWAGQQEEPAIGRAVARDSASAPGPRSLTLAAALPVGVYALVVEAEGRPPVRREFTVREGIPTALGVFVP